MKYLSMTNWLQNIELPTRSYLTIHVSNAWDFFFFLVRKRCMRLHAEKITRSISISLLQCKMPKNSPIWTTSAAKCRFPFCWLYSLIEPNNRIRCSYKLKPLNRQKLQLLDLRLVSYHVSSGFLSASASAAFIFSGMKSSTQPNVIE